MKKVLFICLVLLLSLMMIGCAVDEVVEEGEEVEEVEEAEQYPNRAITLIVPSSAGGAFDVNARAIAADAGEYFGVAMIVKNVPGASFTLGAEELANAEPDGYTLMLSSDTPFAYSPQTMEVQYDPIDDFEFIARVANNPLGILGYAGLPFDDLSEVLAYAKENPGEITVAHSGIRYEVWLYRLAEMGYVFTGVPYPGGGPASIDTGGGHVDLNFGGITPAEGLIEAGLMRVFLIDGHEGSPDFDEYPEMEEAWGMFSASLNSIQGPAGIPQDRLDFIQDALERMVNESEGYQLLLGRLNIEPIFIGQEEYTRHIKEKYKILSEVVAQLDLEE